MSDSNYFNNPVVDRLREIERQLGNLNNSRQPYFGDWYDFSEQFEYVTVQTGSGFRYGRIAFQDESLDPRDFFAIGDKIRFKQSGGTFKYFYVIDLTAAYIEITGGSDYTLVNEEVTDVGRGLVNNPIGHPGLFNYALQITPTAGVYTPSTEVANFYMVGKNVILNVSITGGNLTLAAFLIALAPVRFDAYYRNINIIGGPATGWFEFNTLSSDSAFAVFGALSLGGTFSSGSNANFALQLSYVAKITA
jgi:hypothetical protein